MLRVVHRHDLRKVPGVAETLDWAAALVGLGVSDLSEGPEAVHDSLMCLLKAREDRRALAPEVVDRIIAKVA